MEKAIFHIFFHLKRGEVPLPLDPPLARSSPLCNSTTHIFTSTFDGIAFLRGKQLHVDQPTADVRNPSKFQVQKSTGHFRISSRISTIRAFSNEYIDKLPSPYWRQLAVAVACYPDFESVHTGPFIVNAEVKGKFWRIYELFAHSPLPLPIFLLIFLTTSSLYINSFFSSPPPSIFKHTSFHISYLLHTSLCA